MLNEQVRKLLVASLLLMAVGCGWSRENLGTSDVWGDPTSAPAVAGPSTTGAGSSPYAQPPTRQVAYLGGPAPPPNVPLTPPGATQAGGPNQPFVAASHAHAPATPQPGYADAGQGLNYPAENVQPGHPYQSQFRPDLQLATATTNDPVSGTASQLEQFEPAKIIAQVGREYILAGDVLGSVNQMLAPHREKMTDSQYDKQKDLLVQRMLKQLIDTKLMYVSFLQAVPPDRVEEALGNIRQQANEQYDKEELPKALERTKTKSPAELDAFLRQFGTSLHKQKQQYMELQLGRTAIRQNIDFQPEITHQEMLDYYRSHLADFEYPARARWEKLTSRHDAFQQRAQARYAIGVMGDQVRLGGAPLAAVAKRSSQGLDSEEGGYHDWTTRGSLRSTKLDQAIFGLPPGLLSNVIEDETGFHIIRVIERREAGRTPFLEAQVDIKQTLLKDKRQEQITEFLERLRKETDVWTVFDDATPTQDQTADQTR